MTTEGCRYLAPECRLARERDEYADLHSRCAGNIKTSAGGYAAAVVQRCDCPCHGDGGGDLTTDTAREGDLWVCRAASCSPSPSTKESS